MVAGQEYRLGTEPSGSGRGHGRTDAEPAGFVAGRRDNASATGSAYDGRLASELGAT